MFNFILKMQQKAFGIGCFPDSLAWFRKKRPKVRAVKVVDDIGAGKRKGIE